MTDKSDRRKRLEELSIYVDNAIMMCDDRQDMLALASLMMVYSKNILKSQIGEDGWRIIMKEFAENQK